MKAASPSGLRAAAKLLLQRDDKPPACPYISGMPAPAARLPAQVSRASRSPLPHRGDAIPRLGLRASDLLLVVACAIAVFVEALLRGPADLAPVAYLLALLAAAPLGFRTRAPLASLVVAEAVAVACAAVLHASWSVTVIVFIELYTVARLGDRQRSIVIGAATAVLVVLAILLVDGSVDPQGVATRLPLVCLALALGDTVRSRHALLAAAREREARDARRREEQMRARAAAERLRIARELHDTLGHFLVAINVRASAAIELLDSDGSAEALKDVKHASASALSDLRATLAVLRDQDDPAPTAPTPDLTDLSGLLRHARSAGLDAEVDIDVGQAPVPSAVSGAAYRIVQEALTNVLRHANATSATVRVRVVAGALDVEITDDGSGATPADGSGFGLRGMAERAAALGGRLDAGPGHAGGWSVHAVLPLGGRV